VGHVTGVVGEELVASPEEQAVVAELMEPAERLVGTPPLYSPRAAMHDLLSPGEPVDEPEPDEE
jgi:hypothetical protein